MPSPRRAAGWTALVLVLAACAPAARPGTFSAANVPQLEAEMRANEGDVGAMVRLGAAYLDANRVAEAGQVLRRALAASPADPGATLYLGLTLEEAGEFSEARALYESYVESGGSAGARDQIRDRLTIVRRLELKQLAREALERESEIAASAPVPGTVAVLPFAFVGGPDELRPLDRALAEMLVTDLAQTDRLTVLERLQVQMLLDEMALAEGGLTDPQTGARSGRLLGAERVVQGSIRGEGEGVELEAAVVRVGTGPVGTVADRDELRRLFDLEKRLAFGIYEAMGVQLTPAERQRVNQRPTENVQALLAYGLGLQALDAGNFEQAAEHFSAALQFDANFSAARQRLASAIGAAAAVDVTPREVAQEASGEIAEPLVALNLEVEDIIPGVVARDPAAEALGTEGIGRRTILELIIRRP